MEYQCPECKNGMFFIESNDVNDSISFRCTDCGNEITHGPGLKVHEVVAIMNNTTNKDKI